MKSKFKIFSILITLVFTFSCGDDFLDTKPIATSDDASYYTTMEAAENATTVCYSNFSMEKLWDLSIVMTMGSIASDESEAGAGGKTDIPEFQHIDQLRHVADEANMFDVVYGYLYRGVNYCNTAIAKLPGITAVTDKNYNAETIAKRVGEVHFLRAINYFTLAQCFGGVPLVDHNLAPSEYYQPRATIAEIFTLIKSDLNIAIASLNNRSVLLSNDQIGRASKGAAMALMAKVYLYESSYAKNYPSDERFVDLNEHWDSVNYWCEQVIASGEYELVGIDGTKFDSWKDPTDGVVDGKVGGYTWLFTAEANNSAEEVFSIQCRHDGLGWFFSRGTALIQWCAPRSVNYGGSADGVSFGWGWWCPTDFLVNSYEAGDPRYKATVLEETDSMLYWTGAKEVWVTPNFNVLRAGTGLFRNQRKYEASPSDFWNNPVSWKEGPNNVKLVRYADLILWNAEAYLERGDNTKALENINLVRTRARMSGDGASPADLTGTLTHEQLEHERLVELACEGHRFFDLVRWGIAEQYLDHELADGDQIDFEKGKHEFYPLPATEILLSKGQLVQYPGW